MYILKKIAFFNSLYPWEKSIFNSLCTTREYQFFQITMPMQHTRQKPNVISFFLAKIWKIIWTFLLDLNTNRTKLFLMKVTTFLNLHLHDNHHFNIKFPDISDSLWKRTKIPVLPEHIIVPYFTGFLVQLEPCLWFPHTPYNIQKGAPTNR